MNKILHGKFIGEHLYQLVGMADGSFLVVHPPQGPTTFKTLWEAKQFWETIIANTKEGREEQRPKASPVVWPFEY